MSAATAAGSAPDATRCLRFLEQPSALFGRAEDDRAGAEDPRRDGPVQRFRVGRERHPRRDVARHHPVLRDRDEEQVEEEALVVGRLAAGEQEMEVLGEAHLAHQVAGEVASPYFDPVGIRLADAADGLPGLTDLHQGSRSSRTTRGSGDHRLELAERPLARQVLHPAVRRDDEPLGRHDLEGLPDPDSDDLRRLDLARTEIEDSEDDHLVGEVAEHLRVEIRLRGFEREVRRETVVELAQERVARESVVNDVRVAEAGVEDGLALDAVERAVDRVDGILPRRLGPRLEIRLVDLDDIGSGRLEVM